MPAEHQRMVWLRVTAKGLPSAVMALGLVAADEGDRLTISLDEFGKGTVDRRPEMW